MVNGRCLLQIARRISLAALCLCSAAGAFAQDLPQKEHPIKTKSTPAIHPDRQPASRLCYKLSPQTRITLAPSSDLYPAYTADPRYPRFALTILSMTHSTLARTTPTRVGTAVGSSLGVFRLHPADRAQVGFQLQLGAGVFAQWEGKGRDGIGWDGVYQVLGTFALRHPLAFKLGIAHLSSHVMDEYMENTGRRRLEYTREELVAGMSSSLANPWRTYAEVGYAHLVRSPVQKRWRLQAGLEYQSARVLAEGLAGFFIALDSQSHQENAWEVSLALQAGVVVPKEYLGWTLRMGLEFYRGRSPMGEFFQDEERQIAWGWWLDL